MIAQLRAEIEKTVVGQKEAIDLVIMAMLCNGHALLVGVPGLAKTTLVKSLAQASGLQFGRIQFTPDLMPSDVLGTEMLNADRQLVFQKGPLFAQVLLADEINRTPPKTQSALLEAMQERSVTAMGKTELLPKPFFVLATQNPVEQEGTYPLPEAQLDRFLFLIELGYPTREEEVAIVQRTTTGAQHQTQAVWTANDWLNLQQEVADLPVPPAVVEAAVGLVQATRSPLAVEDKPYIQWGAGPRASQALVQAAKAHAYLNGKSAPDKEDVAAVAVPVMRHRLVLTYQATADGWNDRTLVEALVKKYL
ncbi:MAG: MoxR family ATPase [Schleiferiaceae bacterium]|jgi:MoxR-like ATPase|nr:MoxR family ATPase [Schleiferiaceae bacterium]MDP4627205.1 MoxR family ATPase [Schleiferiaceae bacterium]MDP4727651.1 MoxR family ATPase [Schleiferiaceae bacterium]MDP4749755.1 MoxR family ATPase [Schleiferiaceae bacterium]MDP4859811.1 MoxR family ATPase [Schleiferiaceae bacterium]